MDEETINPYESGSQWRRWNPHIHAPGTLLNDQFGGDWDGYLKAIDDASPVVEVLGITDYLTIDSYKLVVAKKAAGMLSKVKLIFPNVEFRLTIETERRKGINLHLLFNPTWPRTCKTFSSAPLLAKRTGPCWHRTPGRLSTPSRFVSTDKRNAAKPPIENAHVAHGNAFWTKSQAPRNEWCWCTVTF